jgi:hypothetical protein
MEILNQDELQKLSDQEKTELETLAKQLYIERIESAMLEMEQVDCPVIHTFGPGIYIRQVLIPRGTFAIGHKQKMNHMNIFLQGQMLIPSGNGEPKVITAPMMFTASPERKIGYALADIVWLNIYPSNETDVSVLEETFLEKSETWIAYDKQKQLEFRKMIEDLNITENQIQTESENENDQIPMPYGNYKFAVGKSSIHGKGIFASAPITKREIIGPATVNGKRTPIGRFTNHSDTPNAEIVMENGIVYLIALKNLRGCTGGQAGDEITADYRKNRQLRGEK